MKKELIVKGVSTVEELIEKIKPVVYNPEIGLSKKKMMQELEIKSKTTLWERVKAGKIIKKELGGSDRYFFA